MDFSKRGFSRVFQAGMAMGIVTEMVSGWKVDLQCSPNWQDSLRHADWCVNQQGLSQHGQWDRLASGVYWFESCETAVLFELTWG